MYPIQLCHTQVGPKNDIQMCCGKKYFLGRPWQIVNQLLVRYRSVARYQRVFTTKECKHSLVKECKHSLVVYHRPLCSCQFQEDLHWPYGCWLGIRDHDWRHSPSHHCEYYHHNPRMNSVCYRLGNSPIIDWNKWHFNRFLLSWNRYLLQLMNILYPRRWPSSPKKHSVIFPYKLQTSDSTRVHFPDVSVAVLKCQFSKFVYSGLQAFLFGGGTGPGQTVTQKEARGLVTFFRVCFFRCFMTVY